MNNIEMAKSYLEEALRRIKVAKWALDEHAYAYCTKQSQKAVELALKAALRFVGIEPPKWHDVGPVLLENRKRFPEWFDEKIDDLASTSRWLRREREPSMYGDEESGLPPQKLYTRSYSEKAFNEAKFVVDFVYKLIQKKAI